jgi:hypothetical protein
MRNWGNSRRGGVGGGEAEDGKELMKEGRSIHHGFYSNSNAYSDGGSE